MSAISQVTQINNFYLLLFGDRGLLCILGLPRTEVIDSLSCSFWCCCFLFLWCYIASVVVHIASQDHHSATRWVKQQFCILMSMYSSIVFCEFWQKCTVMHLPLQCGADWPPSQQSNNVPLCPLGNQRWADCPCSFASARVPYEQEHPTWSSLPLASFTQQNALVCTHGFGRLDRLFPFITELFHVYGQTKVCFFIPLSLKHPCCFQFVPIIKTAVLNVVTG